MLFTDIEGSTRLLNQLGEAYGDLLADHRRLLREAFAARGGREMDTQGDAFFYAFARARDAALAAVDGQRALAAHAWPEGAECRVRMGLHTGEPTVGEEGYHGIGLHRGARIAHAARGGQILVSPTTAQLLEDDLPPGITLRDLGQRELKDMDRPVRIYELAADGLPKPAASRRSRRPILIAAAIALLVVAAAAAAAVLATSGGSGQPASAAAVSANAVGIFRATDGRPSAYIDVGASPTAVAFGADSLWVANLDAHSVSRIDPAKKLVIQTIPVGDGPAGITYGAGGFVWVTNSLDGTVSKIDPQTNTVVDRIDVGNGPSGIAAGDRYVWVADTDDGTVVRIDSASDKPRRPASVGSGAQGVALGAGSVWVTNSSTGTLTQLDDRTGQVEATSHAGSGASAVTFGEGSVWVANALDGTVARIDPATGNLKAAIPVGRGPNGVAVTAAGVWVTNELSGTLSKIDPATNTPVDSVVTGNRPEAVVASGNDLFAAVRASGAGHRGGTLTLLQPARTVLTVDPAVEYSPPELQLAGLTNDGLVGYRRVGGIAGRRLVPDLAVALPQSTDGGLTYRFRLQRGIRYSTGAVVRPEDIRRGLERAMVEGYEGDYFSHIVGAVECLADTKAPCDLSRGIVADDRANTVTFHLTSPDPEFLNKLALNAASALPAATPVHVKGGLPATGPYMVQSFVPSRGVTLVRNPHFHEWSPSAQPDGFANRIVMRFGGTPAALVAAVEQGQADIATDVASAPPAVLSAVRTQHASRLQINPNGSMAFIALNTRLAPFDSLKARQAVDYAIDRERLKALSLGQGIGEVSCQVLPPSFQGYQPYCPYTRNLARARALVRASGTAGQKVTVWVPWWTNYGADAGRYVASVLSSIGYHASFRAPLHLDPAPLENKLHVQALFSGWYQDYPTDAGFLVGPLACSSYKPDASNTNFSEFCDPAIDREMARAERLQATDPVAATRLWAKVDRDLTDAAPWITFASSQDLELLSNRVGNYQYSPVLGALLAQLWVK
jgi:YVTN family beta-propeller protein